MQAAAAVPELPEWFETLAAAHEASDGLIAGTDGMLPNAGARPCARRLNLPPRQSDQEPDEV